MTDIEPDSARSAAEDLLDLLGAYENELILLAQDAPDLERLRKAVGRALVEASFWILDHEVESARASRTTH